MRGARARARAGRGLGLGLGLDVGVRNVKRAYYAIGYIPATSHT